MPLKTITEFSGSLLVAAARFVTRPQPASQTTEAQVSTVDQSAAPEASPADSGAVAATPTATFDEEGLRAALGISGDRLARLLEALAVVGSRIGQVLKVRVLSGEGTPPPGAKQHGDFYYVVDVSQPQGENHRRGGRGRGGRDERRDGRGGRGGGSRPGGAGHGHSGLEREPPRSEVPATGAGWVLQRAPSDPKDRPGGDRRGPRGRRPGGGDRPGGGRGRPGGGPGRGGPGGGGRRPGGGGGA